MPRIVFAGTSVDITVPAGEKIVVFAQGSGKVWRTVNSVKSLLGDIAGRETTFGTFGSETEITLEAVEYSMLYATGADPVIIELLCNKIQRPPIAISSSTTLPLDAIFCGMVNGSAGLLGITCTLPTGALIDSTAILRVDDSFDWCIISTGLGAVAIAASAGHTIVGSASVGSAQSGAFRTRKSADKTFVTYRVG